MKKTGKSIWVPLSDNAIKWLPERGEALDSDLVFAKLPGQSSNADSRLKTLIRKAGIMKKCNIPCCSTYVCNFDSDIRS